MRHGAARMTDGDLDDLRRDIIAAIAKADRAESRADDAAELALGMVESVKHFQGALEHGNRREADILAATRQLVSTVAAMSKKALEK